MPREIIRADRDEFTVQVEVGWARDKYVQIATRNFGLDPEPLEAHPATAGWYVTLDRDAINRTIRALRKARDQAFGADA